MIKIGWIQEKLAELDRLQIAVARLQHLLAQLDQQEPLVALPEPHTATIAISEGIQTVAGMQPLHRQ